MISFRELLINAKNGDEKALMEMFDLFRPMIEKASRSADRKDEDLHDVIVMAFINFDSRLWRPPALAGGRYACGIKSYFK